MIDTHCHLEMCAEEAARGHGLKRVATVGHRRGRGRARARVRGRARRGVRDRRPASELGGGFEPGDLEPIRRAASHPKVVAIGETGLDYYRDYAPHDDQRRAFEAQIDLARELGKPLVIHTRAAEDDTFAVLADRAEGVTVVMHCFSAAGRLDECVERGYMCSFAGNVTYPKATDLQDAATRVPDDLLLVETDAPFLAPAAGARQAERARQRRAHGAQGGGVARRLVRGPRAACRAQRRARLRLVSGQGSIRRLREFDVRPNRELGQNFLVDDNVLRLVADAAELSSSDVVLEVGGGLGVLSEHLAPRVRHLHVVEVDRSLEPPLRDAVGGFDNVELHFADAVQLDMAALRPAPDKVVANLPYGVAATVVLKSIEELPDATLWVAMAQLEVGRRLAAAPGSKVYGATSVLAQLSCEVKVLRRISRNVFHPVPNVESALVRLRRVAPPPDPAVAELVHAAFAHRRKTLAGSLALSGGDRERAQAALIELGHPADARAERLSPDDFRRLAEILRA